jgi:TIR domain
MYLSALTEAFRHEGHLEDPFWLDREKIKPGDLWRTKIFEAMEEAHAAVLLLSKEAVHESDFVKIEAAYLIVRNVKQFPLVLVLIDVDIADFLQGIWQELDIKSRQTIKGCNPQEAALKTLEFVKVNLDLDRISPRNPLDKLRAAIVNDLRRAHIGRDDILMLAGEIADLVAGEHGRPPPAGTDEEVRRWLAKVLVDATPELLETALLELKDICSDNTVPLVAMLNRLAPRWVNEQTAKLIGFIARGRPADRNFAISVLNEWTLQAYSCRARGCRYGENILLKYSAPDREFAGESFERDAESIEAFVLDRLRLDPCRADLIKRYFEQQDNVWPIMVSLQEEWWPPHPDLIAALRKRLGNVAFRFSPAPDRPTPETIMQLPTPTANEENDAYIRYERVNFMLK